MWILSQGFPGCTSGRESACQWRGRQRLWFKPWEAWIWFLPWEVPLEEEMATHSSILAWKIPWTEEREGLQSMASQCQTWLRRYASHIHKYWANFFMPPYTPDLKHNSSTRSKKFKTLPLSLAIFFFFTLTCKKLIDETQTGTWLLST